MRIYFPYTVEIGVLVVLDAGRSADRLIFMISIRVAGDARPAEVAPVRLRVVAVMVAGLPRFIVASKFCC